MPLLDKKLALMKKVILESPKTDFEIQMMGGELFYDELDDKYFDKYFEIILEISNYAKSLNKIANWVITSNLVHKNTERVINLLRRIENENMRDKNIKWSEILSDESINNIINDLLKK